MIGFSFKGIHSSEMGVGVRSIDRTLKPARKKNQREFPSGHGRRKEKRIIYDNRNIKVEIVIFETEDWVDLRMQCRDIAGWLEGEGYLKFDDETDKQYYGEVSDALGIEQFQLQPNAKLEVTFDCQPFAHMVKTADVDKAIGYADYPWTTPIPWDNHEKYHITATRTRTFYFNNPGTVDINHRSQQPALNQIIVDGRWDKLRVTVNGVRLYIDTNASGVRAVFDSIAMTIKVENSTTNLLEFASGDLDKFFTINPGENKIEISGTSINVDVYVKFIPLWL